MDLINPVNEWWALQNSILDMLTRAVLIDYWLCITQLRSAVVDVQVKCSGFNRTNKVPSLFQVKTEICSNNTFIISLWSLFWISIFYCIGYVIKTTF